MVSVILMLFALDVVVLGPARVYIAARILRSKVGIGRIFMTSVLVLALSVVGWIVSVAGPESPAPMLVLQVGILVVLTWSLSKLLRLSILRGLGVIGLCVVMGVAVGLVLRAAAVEAFVAPAGSMAPTILPGDRLLVDKLTPRYIAPRRGDVVVYTQSNVGQSSQMPAEQLYVKRIVGLPGDRVEIDGESVFVNGRPVGKALPPRRIRAPFEGEIPAGKMYLVGDADERSLDSRTFGPADLTSIKGKVAIVYLSQEMSAWPPYLARRAARRGRFRWDRLGKVIR